MRNLVLYTYLHKGHYMYLKTQNKILKGKASLYFCIGQLPRLQLQLYGYTFSRLQNI